MVRIILGIPGPWQDVDVLQHAVLTSSDGYRLENGVLTAPTDQACFQLELIEHDAEVHNAFEVADRRSLSRPDLDRIQAHQKTAYLIGPGGSLDLAREAMQAAGALLKAGGYAVRVETAGVAHSRNDWLEQCKRAMTHVGALYIGYVALIKSADDFYSCGMHNLGLRDAIVSRHAGVTQPADLLRGFLLSLIHQPHSFRASMILDTGDGRRYCMDEERCRTYLPDDPFYNPFGMWRLTLA